MCSSDLDVFRATRNVHNFVWVHQTRGFIIDVHLCHPGENDVGLSLGVKMSAGWSVGIDWNFRDPHDKTGFGVVAEKSPPVDNCRPIDLSGFNRKVDRVNEAGKFHTPSVRRVAN